MEIPRNLVLVISFVQGRACMRIEPLIAKRNGRGPSGGPSLILEGFRQSYLKILCVEPGAVWKRKTLLGGAFFIRAVKSHCEIM